MKTKNCKTTYCIIWSYDNFKYNYEVEDKEYDDIKTCLFELLALKKENREFHYNPNFREPLMSLRIREITVYFNEPDIEYIADYNVRKYKNRYRLSRAEDII